MIPSTNTPRVIKLVDLLEYLDGRGIIFEDETLVKKALEFYDLKLSTNLVYEVKE